MTFTTFLIFYLWTSGDEIEVGLVQSEPSERDVTTSVPLTSVSELVAAPTLVETQGAAMEEPIPLPHSQKKQRSLALSLMDRPKQLLLNNTFVYQVILQLIHSQAIIFFFSKYFP